MVPSTRSRRWTASFRFTVLIRHTQTLAQPETNSTDCIPRRYEPPAADVRVLSHPSIRPRRSLLRITSGYRSFRHCSISLPDNHKPVRGSGTGRIGEGSSPIGSNGSPPNRKGAASRDDGGIPPRRSRNHRRNLPPKFSAAWNNNPPRDGSPRSSKSESLPQVCDTCRQVGD